MSKLIITLVFLTLICLTSLTAEAVPLTINDALGRRVEVSNPPKRVVSLAPSITEILFELNAHQYIVGADDFSLEDWYLNISRILGEQNTTSVGGYWWSTVSVEKILGLNPDLVLADKGAHKPLLEVFQSYNVTVVYLNGGSARSVNDVLSDIYLLGELFNSTIEAQTLADKLINSLETGRTLLEEYHGLRVLIVVDFWQGIWVAGRATYIDDVLARLGLSNAASTFGWSSVSLEKIYEWRPDIIVVATPYASQEMIREAGLFDLGVSVVVLEREKVDILSRPGPMTAMIPEVLHAAFAEAFDSAKPTSTPEHRQGISEVFTLLLLLAGVALAFTVGYYVGRK
jgi:iron complex transport system substrate-binding protein